METIILLYFAIILAVVVTYARITHDILNPLTLFYLPLVLNYAVFFTLYQGEYQLSLLTNLLALLGSASFSAGYFLISAYGRYERVHGGRSGRKEREDALILNEGIKKFLILFGLTGFGVGICEFFYYGLSGEGAFLINVRRNYMYGHGVSPLSKYGTFVLFFISCVCFYQILNRRPEKGRYRLGTYLLMVFSLLSTLFSMARTILLSYALAYAYLYLRSLITNVYVRKRAAKKKLFFCYGGLVLLLVLLAAVFCFFASGLGKTGADTLLSKDFFLYKYLGYSLVAFDRYIREFPGVTNGYYSLGPFGKLFLLLGIYPDDILKSFGAPVGEFNVYSYIGALFLDYGPLGLFLPMFIIGLASGYLYRKVRKCGGFWTIFYANFSYALVIAFYAYQFSNTTFLYCLLLILLLKLFRGRYLLWGKINGRELFSRFVF